MEETASQTSAEETLSNSELVGEFFGQMRVGEVVDEDVLLESDQDDQEDVNVTIIPNTE